MAQLVRVQNFNVSRDGFGAGEDQSLERPFGHAEPDELMAWAGATASWPNRTDPGGTRGLDDYFTRDFAHNIGAEIMGRNKFGPAARPVGATRNGRGGGATSRRSTLRCSCSRITSVRRSRCRTRHSTSSTPRPRKRSAGEGGRRRQGRAPGWRSHDGREFLDADLVDTMHIAVAPMDLERGERLWSSSEELLDRFELDVVPSPRVG